MSVFFLSLFPACLAACISVSIPVCAVGPVGLSQSADYTHDKPNFLLALHSGSFRALRISFRRASSVVPSSRSRLCLRIPSPIAAVELAVLRQKKKTKTAEFRLVPESQQAGTLRFSGPCSMMTLCPPHPQRF